MEDTHQRQKLYNRFMDAFVKANPQMKRQEQYKRAQKAWKVLFQGKDVTAVETEILELKEKAANLEKKKMNVWTSFFKKKRK